MVIKMLNLKKHEKECLVSFDSKSIFLKESFKAHMVGVEIFE